jgi:hypothetical protein
MNWNFYFTAAICIWPYLAGVFRTDELFGLDAKATAAVTFAVSLMFAPLIYLLLLMHLVAYVASAALGEQEAFWAVLNGADRL